MLFIQEGRKDADRRKENARRQRRKNKQKEGQRTYRIRKENRQTGRLEDRRNNFGDGWEEQKIDRHVTNDQKTIMDSTLISLENEAQELKPAFWYEGYWLHRINCEGLESIMRRYDDTVVPGFESVGGRRGNAALFYWRTISAGDGDDKTEDGKTLYAKVHRDSSEFEPVVSIIRSSVEPLSFRLYASRDYCTGEAIVFLSKLEEDSEKTILGGKHARIVANPDECNAYLTANRMLRCVKPIKRNEEITRCANGQHLFEHLEYTDRVVVSLENFTVGKIGNHFVQGALGNLISFPKVDVDPGDHSELARRLHVHVYRNHSIR